MDYPGEFVDSLLGLSRVNLNDGPDIETLLNRVADLAVEQLDGCDMAGVTMMGKDGPTTAVFTNPAAPDIDAAQYAAGRGPCLDAFRTGTIKRIDETAEDLRWPAFATAAMDAGVRSALALPLVTEEAPLGALNMYSYDAGTFQDSEQIAAVFVAHAASILSNAQSYWASRTLSEQLQQALASRPVIEQAKGILMNEHRCDADQAFQLLQEGSQHTNRKLRVLAAEIVEQAIAGTRPRPEPEPLSGSRSLLP
jgi:GAF domain-containing protein